MYIYINIHNALEYHCSEAELTPDLVAHIRHFPVKQTLLQNPWRILAMAGNLMDFANFIPSLVCLT